MKKNIIDLKKLNKITVDLIREKNFSLDDKQIRMISRNQESFWGLISSKYYGAYNYNSSLLFYHWWIRNTNNFYCLVKSTLENFYEKKHDNQHEKQLKEIFVKLSFSEWTLFQKEITGKSRKKFKVKFTDFLSEKIQSFGINCWLKCKYNWFSTNKSKSTPFWVGNYKCLDEKCKQNLKACIMDPINENDFVHIQIKFSDFGFHNKISKIKRIIGDERNNLAVKLKATGISNIRNENIILNNLDKSLNFPTNKNTLAQIKFEFDHKERLSNDIISDIKATKLVCDNLCLTKTSEFKGFIHNISLDPYGFLMMTDIQIKMWEIIGKKHPVWYFDATGSVHKDIYQQKKPFLFSIVSHDIEKKCIIPVAEFITTCHTSNNIAKFLSSIQNFLENYMISTDFTVAPIIVTDFSWALINSVMKQFNGMTIQHYLNWCFQILFHYSGNQQANYLVRSRIYLCSTHFLKNVIKKARKVKIKEYIKNTFIFCFSLLQNSQTIEQFNKYLLNIYNIFQNQLYDETVLLSLEFLRQEIKNRELECLDISGFETAEQEAKQKDSENTTIFLGPESVETIIKSSPFNSYYLHILDQFNIELINKQKLKIENDKNYKLEPNEFFSRNLFEIILEQLYIMPLWSGVMLNQYKLFNKDKYFSFTTRLSNNPVENYFGNIKHNLIPTKKVYPSELVSPIYKRLKAKYFEFYLNIEIDEKPKKNVPKMINNIQESWSDKNEKKKNVKKQSRKEKIDDWKKEKGFFYKKIDISRYIYNNIDDINHISKKLPSEIIDEAFKISKINNENQSSSDENEKIDDAVDKLDKIEKSISTIKNIYEKFNYNNNLPINQIKNMFNSERDIFIEVINFLRDFEDYKVYLDQKIEESIYFEYIIRLFDLNGFFPVKTSANGNCFYNSLSIIIFGSEKNYFLFKMCSVFMLIEYEELFNEIIIKHKYDKINNIDDIILSTVKKNEWAMMLNILATSIVMDRAIYCYCLNPTVNIPYGTKYNLSHKNKRPILIAFYINHFSALLAADNSIKFTDLECDLFINFRTKDHIRDYFKID